MIREEEVYRIGQITKPHGIKGELIMNFTDDSFDQEDCDYIILRMDGILVPFFISDLRYRSDSSCLITLDGIDTEEKARRIAGADVYFPLEFQVEQEDDGTFRYQDVIGFTASEVRSGILGRITYVDESTMNVLMAIDHQGREILVPMNEEFVKDIDLDTRTVLLDLPSGLLDLDHAVMDTDEI